MNVAVVEPEATVTLAGRVAASVLELVRVITTPALGAGPEIVTVPVTAVVVPPTTEVGLTATETRVGAWILSVAVLVVVPNVPVMVEVVLDATAVVAIAKVAVFAPASTVTEAGKVALALLEVRPTTVPPVGALPVKVTVPVEPVPPVTVLGATVTEARCGGRMVRVAVCCDPLSDAVTVSVSDAATVLVVIVKFALVDPVGIVTVAGN